MANVEDILRGDVTLEVACVGRMYLNGYVPLPATPGGLVTFMRQHLGKPIPSPVVLGRVTTSFRERVREFADSNGIPIVPFSHGERKDDTANRLRRERGVRNGVVFIGVAQEKAKTFSGKPMPGHPGWFEFDRGVQLRAMGPEGLLERHEWAKRQLEKRELPFEALDKTFLSCKKPEELQAVFEQLGARDIEAILSRWLERLPMPLAKQDRQAGYDWRVSIWQMGAPTASR